MPYINIKYERNKKDENEVVEPKITQIPLGLGILTNGGEAGAGAVRYDQEQTLTEEQRARARKNIGAGVDAADVSGLIDRVTAIENQLYVPISIASFTVNPSKLEIGTVLTEAKLDWKYNKPEQLNKQTIFISLPPSSNKVDNKYTTYTATFSGENRSNAVTFTLQAEDVKDNKVVTKTATTYFYNKVYYGVASAPSSFESLNDLIKSLSGNELSGGKVSPFTVTANEGQYIYYCLPERMGTCTFNIGGFDGGFELVAIKEFTNSSQYTENYRIYKSVEANLGNTTVSVS